jgi:sugar/nucleoside kinase (ribokinase family)
MSAETWDLMVIGHPSVDLMFAGLPEWPELGKDVFAADFGMSAGTSFNTPAAANRLGLRVGYVSMLGNDVWSHLVRQEYESEGLPTEFLRVVDRPMPFVSVAMNFGGDRGFVSYEGIRPEDEDELKRYALDVISEVNARHLHTYAAEEPAELVELSRRRGMTVSVDAWNGPWWEASAPLEEILSAADVLLANEQEALAMTGEDDTARALRRLGELSGCVVIKRGGRGAMAVADGEVREVAADTVEALDTTGAGDCFNAGFLLGWLGQLPLEHCLTLGAICGAASVASFGGYRGCPHEAALRAAAAERGIDLPKRSDGSATTTGEVGRT